jgi:hypothetical protein
VELAEKGVCNVAVFTFLYLKVSPNRAEQVYPSLAASLVSPAGRCWCLGVFSREPLFLSNSTVFVLLRQLHNCSDGISYHF